MKKCTKCGVEKPLSEFYKNRNKPRTDCKICHEKVKMKSKVGAYGLTLEQYSNLFIKQNNKCGICGCVFINKKHTHIDHNHKTGTVRGLLCHGCNTAIGLFKESTNNLKSALKYLKKYSDKTTGK
jgi:hypothetical protein